MMLIASRMPARWQPPRDGACAAVRNISASQFPDAEADIGDSALILAF
jgi:hypothetical protein